MQYFRFEQIDIGPQSGDAAPLHCQARSGSLKVVEAFYRRESSPTLHSKFWSLGACSQVIQAYDSTTDSLQRIAGSLAVEKSYTNT